ncbi:MAG TPA: glycosyltransferase family 39 protein, partial [Gemmatimonadaceae bacterium]|nr:glycosyltransferase family 39 protein [Gemmatimonadaceae bacterium]
MTDPHHRRPPLATSVVLPLAALVLAAHLATNLASPYGIHRDELLYLAMGRHLRLWAMDFPPGIALIAEGTRAILGDSLAAIRAVPALAAAAILALAALVARELGGGRRAQGLAALAVLASPLFLRAGNLFQPVVLDQLWWTLALYAVARAGAAAEDARGAMPDESRGPARWWMLAGAACGLGLLTKFSIIFFALSLAAGVVLSPQRRALATPWPWIAVVIALAIGSPSIVGQIRLGYPVLGQMHDLRGTQLERVGAGEYLGGQLWMIGPALLLAVIGAASLLRSPAMRAYRVVGWTCVAVFVLLLALHGKSYYAGPIYPALFGAGAAALERWRAPREARVGRLAPYAVAGLIIAYGVVTLPFGLPVLPPRAMARYAAAVGMTHAVTTNTGEVLPLPQDYADMLGWEAQARAVARVWHALPPERRERAVIIAGNYGEAGAVDFYGPRLGLPPVVSPAGSYWFFGPGEKPGEVVVTIGVDSA